MDDKIDKVFVAGWVIMLVFCLASWSLLGWGFIELVQWVTSK